MFHCHVDIATRFCHRSYACYFLHYLVPSFHGVVNYNFSCFKYVGDQIILPGQSDRIVFSTRENRDQRTCLIGIGDDSDLRWLT